MTWYLSAEPVASGSQMKKTPPVVAHEQLGEEVAKMCLLLIHKTHPHTHADKDADADAKTQTQRRRRKDADAKTQTQKGKDDG